MARKTFPAFPAHAQPVILRIWQEAHYLIQCWPRSQPVCASITVSSEPSLHASAICLIHGMPLTFNNVFPFDTGAALYWTPYNQIPEHRSVTKSICARWVATLGINLPGRCVGGLPTFYAAYQGIKHSSTRNINVSANQIEYKMFLSAWQFIHSIQFNSSKQRMIEQRNCHRKSVNIKSCLGDSIQRLYLIGET